MESNRDEAEKCLEIAKKCLRAGNREKAKRFLERCLRMYPLKDASGLLEALERNGTSSAGSEEQSERHSRKRTKSEGKSYSGQVDDDDYTKEQLDAVNRIQKCKDFYEILNVSKSADETELKKSYRKLALQFHPDKNKAPGATEAFKRIGTAFAVLSDPDKKRRYEEYGETLGPAQRHTRHYSDLEREFEDISPEDIFNMFFGGGFPTGRVYVQRRNRHQHHHAHFQNREEQNVPAYYPIMQLLPILILVAFSLFSSLLVQDPPYSFHQNGNYIHPRVTNRHRIQYFVQKTFSNSYHGDSLEQLERRIERDYIEKVQINCFKERQYKQEMLYQARVWGNHEMLRKAENLEMRSCKQLEDLVAQ